MEQEEWHIIQCIKTENGVFYFDNFRPYDNLFDAAMEAAKPSNLHQSTFSIRLGSDIVFNVANMIAAYYDWQ